MEQPKRFWRALLFISLLAALCGSFAFPLVSLPVSAAPRMQNAADLVISEVRFRGSGGASDEFIELFNPTAGTINLNGWKVNGSNNSGSTGTRYTFTTDILLQPGQHFLLANIAMVDSVTADAIYGTGITSDGGVALLRPDNSIADAVGLNNGSAYKEGTVLPNLTSDVDQSYERNLGGVSGNCDDSNNNSTDFLLVNPSNPQNLTSPVTYCPGLETFTPTNTLADTDTPTPTNTSTVTNTVPAAVPGVVISEFRTRGPAGANDEFIELYNPTSSAIDISGWKINSSNDSGGVDNRATIPASTLLRSGQYYLIANNNSNGGYSNTSETPDLTYGQGISDNGGIALLRLDNTLVDQVGLHADSAYKEGTPLAPLSGNTDQSYERKPGGASDSCQDTNNNSNDFANRSPSNPQNSSTPLRLCGIDQPDLLDTTTTITSDSPDPSLVNGNVTVNVTVSVPSSPGTISTGKVNVTITGTGLGCTLTLNNSTGKGSCTVVFSSSGTKTISATYLGDNRFNKSSDTESHQVTTTATPVRTPTRTPTPPPPPPLLVINEFVPRPGRDWNNDGIVNVEDEYIEILNHGVVDVNLSGYSLDDEVNIGSAPYRLPSHVLRPGERIVFYGSETGLLLSDGGDGVRLLRPNGQLMDAYNYFVVGYPDQAFCRLPDNGGADDWNRNCFPTPGRQNSLSGNVPRPSTGGVDELYCPIADTLPEAFARAECDPYGNNIWRAEYWDRTGWYGKRYLPESNGRWPVFAD